MAHSSLLPIILLFLFFPLSHQLQLHPTDYAALFDIHLTLRDLPGSTFFSTWDFPDGYNSSSSRPCQNFSGIVCSLADDDESYLRVSVLTLGTGLADSPGLEGSLPPSLSNLTSLTDLVVYPGQVSGEIPSDLGARLRRLRLLSISRNRICGGIPASLAGLPDLHTLDLGYNRLEGQIPIPLLLPSSTSLKVLILAGNGGLSGEIPPEFSAAQLLHLDLRGNSVSGGLPPIPSTLRYLSLSGNSMSGLLDSSFTLPLPDLEFLDLSSNNFSGAIPPVVFSLPRLSSILLQRNKLSGGVELAPPPPPPPPPEWSVVDLSHNFLSGEVPAGLAAAGSLFLNDNRMTGVVPEEVVRMVFSGRMTTFYAQHNFLTAFPAPPLQLPESVALCLSYNCMEIAFADASAGCPVSAGTLLSRPPYQCHGGGGG
ncbi:receptor-like protein 32 [Typha latifolia]|uniref:receptor-like protein 32 n=1 Tax=Typha latifolia TaxID=4733 RepID=UPI003C2FBD56